MKTLILGATGFVGSHLSEHLLASWIGPGSEAMEVHGTCRDMTRSDLSNIRHLLDEMKLHQVDICSETSCRDVLAKVQPDVIYHLAALAYVPLSWDRPESYIEVNVRGVVNLLEAVRLSKLDPVVIYSGSSEAIGFCTPEECSVDEKQPLKPRSPYGASRAAGDMLYQVYHHSYGLKTVPLRLFNHEGARRGREYAWSNFAWQIARIEKGLQKPEVKVGNLEAVRDFLHVKDVCRAYRLATRCKFGEPYIVASGEGTRIGDGLEKLIDMAKVPVSVVQDPDRMRPSDIPLMRGNPAKFMRDTGWDVRLNVGMMLRDMLEYWRERV